MNKFTYQTIRAGFVFAVAMFMVTGTAFASVDVVYTEATNITTTSAVLNSQIINSNNNSSVWFEWGDNQSLYAPTISGNQKFGGKGGSFNTTIDGLTPGTTYYYRAVIVSYPILGAAEAPVYSRTFSFKTLAPKSTTGGVGTTQSGGQTSGTQYNNSSSGSQTNTSTNNSSTKNTSNTTVKNTTKTTNSSNEGFTNGDKNSDGFTNGSTNSALVVGAGDGILPTTLIGWILLIIAFLIILLIVRMIYEDAEKRKKARQIKKANGVADQEIEKEKKEEVRA